MLPLPENINLSMISGFLRGARRDVVLDACDMEDGACRVTLGDILRPKRNPNNGRISRYQQRIVVRDVIGFAVRHANPKWHERVRCHTGFEF